MDLEALERRVERAALTPDEIGDLDELLRSEADAATKHRALLILSRRPDADGEHALHALIERGTETELAILALQTLCVRWQLSERYIGMLRHFVRGVAWDIARGSGVRRAAIAIAGEHLASHSDTELMFDLIQISEEEPDEATRTAAVRALARATGYRGKAVDLRIDL